MRKATGKVVSLVLALALVVTSFSSTLAFAATKTETGTATVDTNKDLYLANTNGKKYSDGDPNKDNDKFFNLTEYIFNKGVRLETYDHIIVDTDKGDEIEISQVTVSGDNIVKVTKLTENNAGQYDGDKDDYIVSVRDTKGTGKATLNVLFKADTDRGDDEITVRGSVKIDVTLLDAETPILAPSTPEPGKAVGSFDGLKKNYTKDPKVKDEDGKDQVATLDDACVLLPTTNGSAIATYEQQALYSKGDENTTYAEGAYVISVSGTKSYLADANGATSIAFGVMNPTVGNTVRLTASSVKKNDKDVYVINKTVDTATVKVENKVEGAITEIDVGDGDDHFNVNGKFDDDTLMSKSKTYAQIGNDYWDVTGATVKNTGAAFEIVAGRVGDVTSDNGVTVNDGTVGNISTKASVNLYGGSITSVKAENEASNVLVDGATVGEIKDADTLTVNSGKVTGAVSADSVILNPANDEEPVSVGAVSAHSLTVDGTVAAAAAGAFKMTSAGTITLIGKNASVSGIDFDYRNGRLVFQNFVGTVPAPTKGTFTGYDQTGAYINTADDEDEDATNATVSGNLAIYEISLDNGTVTLRGQCEGYNVAAARPPWSSTLAR